MEEPTGIVPETDPDAPAPDVIHCRGMQFPRDKSLLPRRMRRSLRLESYEGKEAEAALRLIRRGDVVLELGGGIGFMSTLIATKTRAREVHSFEANPRLIDYIREVHSLNKAKKAQVHHAVLGQEDGSATFYLRQDILSSSLDRLSDDDEATEQTVPMQNSSTVFQNIEPTVLVCDIEGAESTLIPQLDLSGLRAVLIELHPQWIGRDGIRDVFAHLHQSGLVFFPRMSHGKVAVFRSDW